MPDPTMNQHPIGGGSRADKPMFSAELCACTCTCDCDEDTEDRSYVLCPPCTTRYRVRDGRHGPK